MALKCNVFSTPTSGLWTVIIHHPQCRLARQAIINLRDLPENPTVDDPIERFMFLAKVCEAWRTWTLGKVGPRRS